MKIELSEVPKRGGQCFCRKCKQPMKRGTLRMYVDMRDGYSLDTGGYVCDKCVPEFRNDIIDVLKKMDMFKQLKKGDKKLALLHKNSPMKIIRETANQILTKE